MDIGFYTILMSDRPLWMVMGQMRRKLNFMVRYFIKKQYYYGKYERALREIYESLFEIPHHHRGHSLGLMLAHISQYLSHTV